MDDLIAFVTARLDEDEAGAARIALDPDYEAGWHEQSSGVLYVGPGSKAYPLDGLQPMGDSRLTRFIADHDPARVLREVAAKRAILAEHAAGADPCDAHDASLRTIPCDTVLHIAAVWSDHDDYRQEWAPEP